MKIKDMHGLKLEELKVRERELGEEIFKIRLSLSTGGEQSNPMKLRNLKKDLARIKTLIRAKKE